MNRFRVFSCIKFEEEGFSSKRDKSIPLGTIENFSLGVLYMKDK